MIIKSIRLQNFQLFIDQTINFSSINLITGINFDSLEENGNYSGNGSGKTTILNALLFGLFGEVTDINLKELIRLGKKEATITLECQLNNDNLRIIRKIPNELHIFINEKELLFNTSSLAQVHLQGLLGTNFQHYRTYNIIDQKKGINLLDLGITSLRKSLMDFVNEQFISIRQSLLSKKLERETYNVNKKLYNFYLSSKRQKILEEGLIRLQEELTLAKTDADEQFRVVNNYRSEISSKEKIIYYKKNDIEKATEGICPILKQKCDRIGNKMTDKDKAQLEEIINNLKQEIIEIQNLLESEEDCLEHYNKLCTFIQKRVQNTKEYLMKLKEAQKFSAYKYTSKDVQIYTDGIKVLDSFSSYYISEWLGNLSIVINDLLKGLNLSVEFSIDKDFIKINNNGQILSYNQLSSGQKKFLGTIFKIGILLQEGINSGILLFDEGLGDIDVVNFNKLVDILKELSNFQCVIIYQNCPKDLKEVNYVQIERKEGVSKVG